MLSRLLLLGVNHKILTLLCLCLITGISISGLDKLHIDTGFNSLIPENLPSKIVYNRVAEEFGTDNRTIIYLKDPDLWTPAKLQQLESLHKNLQSLDFVTRIDSLFSLRSIKGEHGGIVSNPLMKQAPDTQQQADNIRQETLNNPLLSGHFISDDGTTTAIILSIQEQIYDNTFNQQANQAIETQLNKIRPHLQDVFQVGPSRINTDIQHFLYQDFLLLAPLSALILILSILFFMRSLTAALIPIITSVISIVWTFGFMGWMGIPINLLSAMLPSLIVVIGATEDTHMVSAFFQGLNKTPNNRPLANQFMLKRIGISLLLTLLTTSIGFASNLFNDIKLIQDFAIASTFAIICNGLVTLLLVPMILTYVGSKQAHANQHTAKLSGLPAIIIKVFRVTQTKFPRGILVITFFLAIFFIHQASNLYVTNDPLSYFPDNSQLVTETTRLHQDLAGVKVFYVTLESHEDKSFLKPENLKKLKKIQDFMDKQGIYDKTLSIADFLSYVNREFHQGEAQYHDIPISKELVAQYLLFFHRSDIESYVSHDYRRANIIVRYHISDSHTLNHYISELQQVASYIAGKDMKAHVVGENLMINAAAEALMSAQVKSLSILLLVIFLLMSIMFTSFKGGLIALIPSTLPIILLFGMMGSLGIPLNPGTAMVAVIAIGIAIDGTIHLFSRYNENCRWTANYQDAVNQAVQEEALPLITTSISLALGFAILLMSNFSIIAQFGALAAATLLFSIIANLLITPIIMSRTRLIGLHQILAMSVNKKVFEKSPLFADMTHYQRRKAVIISETHRFKAGETLVTKGSRGRSMYLILSGQVKVSIHPNDILTTLEEGDIFGEIGYVKETQRTADVIAIHDVEVLVFNYTKLRKDLKYFPHIVAQLNFNISRILGERLADAVEGMGRR